MSSRILLLALLAAAALIAPAHAAVVGISDQGASTWHDPRARALGLAHARLIVPYDAALTEPDRVQAWIAAAASAGLHPHVAFEHVRLSRCPARPCAAPSRAEYARAVRAFIARFPQVRTFTTWNEANHQSQPVASQPEAVAGYYEELRAACPSCTIVAGDVLDSGSYVRWLERFRAATTTNPQLWGLHNYGDVTYGRTDGTDAVLQAVPGELWIEETGGIVTLRNALGRTTLAGDEQRAAAAITRAFALAKARPRITRMYVYHWKAGARDRFDAGLLRPDGTPRPSYDALVAGLRSGAALPSAAAAAPRQALRWRAWWSKGRLLVRATARPASRGRVTIVLRRRVDGRWIAKRLTNRTYRTGTALRIRVSKRLRRGARQARLTFRPAGGTKRSVTLRPR